ncbi:MAG: hypothetical protein LBT35_00625 [Tannerella sp.]|jgi:hypothetical protein|nr:hypothetical protein [Tannerella sp.]
MIKKILLGLMAIFTFASSDVSGYYGSYTPIFMDRAELEKSVSYKAEGRPLETPGKIYCKEHYIFINELYKGVHVINNTDATHPVNEGYIVAPGCVDIAVKNNVIYLDNSVDLVAFDLTTKQVTHRERNVFPEPCAPDNSFSYYYSSRPTQDAVIVGWKKTQK